MNNAIPPTLATARVVYFHDRNDAAQQAWIDLVVSGSTKSAVSENYIAGISSVHRGYDVLIVSGNDPRRINKLIRHYRPILGDKAKIAVMGKSTPADRAQLLNGGFDDVFDLRTNIVEARVRMLSHVERYRNRKMAAVSHILPASGDSLDHFFTARPTPVEARVFKQLISAAERPVPIPELCANVPKDGTVLSRRSLQVFICRIRKKLMPGLAIRFCGEAGYLLQFNRRSFEH